VDIPFLDRLLSISETAEWLGCQPDSVRAAIRTGRLPAMRAGHKLVRVHPRSVIEICSVAAIRRDLKAEDVASEMAEEEAAAAGSDAKVDWNCRQEQESVPVETFVAEPVPDNRSAQ